MYVEADESKRTKQIKIKNNNVLYNIRKESEMTTQELQQIVDKNSALQKRAQNLNIRNGSYVFDIMNNSELKTWLSERLNGSRSIAEISNPDVLILPELDQKFVKKILKDNPDQITLDGQSFSVQYEKDWRGNCFASIAVEEDFARNTKLEKINLPGGREVLIVCNSHQADNFVSLVEKLEQSRIERAWSEARNEQESSRWITDPENVFPELEKVFQTIEITRTDNGNGEPIFGYYSLHSDSDPDFKIQIRNSLEEAEQETSKSLQRLFTKATQGISNVPNEMPWKREPEGWYSSLELTPAGNALKNQLENLQSETTTDLTPANVQEKIQQFKSDVEKIKSEINQKFVEYEELIQQTQVATNEKISALSNSDAEILNSEIEQISSLINQARENLNSLNYNRVKEFCSKATELAESLVDVAKNRIQSEEKARQSYSEIEENLFAISRHDGYFYNASNEDEDNADEFIRAIEEFLRYKEFDKALSAVELAKEFIASVREQIKKRDVHNVIIDNHLQKFYSNTDFFEADPVIARYNNEVICMYKSNDLFQPLWQDLEQVENDKYTRIMESRLNGDIIACLEAKISYDEIIFVVRVADFGDDELLSSEEDLQDVEVVEVWQRPKSTSKDPEDLTADMLLDLKRHFGK